MLLNVRLDVFTGVDKGDEIVGKPRRRNRSAGSFVENRPRERLKAATAGLGALAKSLFGLGREVTYGDASHCEVIRINQPLMIACNHYRGKSLPLR